MYLSSLSLHHLKRIRALDLSFEDAFGKARPVTVLIGPNGTAKTSILQAIALCAAGPIGANVLADQQIGVLRDRRSSDALELVGTFKSSSGATLRSSISLGTSQSYTLGGEQETAWPEDEAFVVGYGVSRSLPGVGENAELSRLVVDRLRNLFTANSSPTSLRFADHLEDSKRFAALLQTAVKAAGLVPGLRGIELRGSGAVRSAGDLIERERFQMESPDGNDMKIPAMAMSHGYQATISWIADLIGHAMLQRPELRSLEDIRGIVLIDELDAFLHPAWQRGLVGGMRAAFRHVQFIVSTHSPILLTEVSPDAVIRLQLNVESGDVERVVHDEITGDLRAAQGAQDIGGNPDPRLLAPSALLRDWFGLDDVSKGIGKLGQDLYAYRELEASGEGKSGEARKLKNDLVESGVLKGRSQTSSP
jgi:predicted ATPase